MKIEFETNKLNDKWWFSLGISYQTTNYHPMYRKVFSLDLGFWTYMIRWDIKNRIDTIDIIDPNIKPYYTQSIHDMDIKTRTPVDRTDLDIKPYYTQSMHNNVAN